MDNSNHSHHSNHSMESQHSDFNDQESFYTTHSGGSGSTGYFSATGGPISPLAFPSFPSTPHAKEGGGGGEFFRSPPGQERKKLMKMVQAFEELEKRYQGESYHLFSTKEKQTLQKLKEKLSSPTSEAPFTQQEKKVEQKLVNVLLPIQEEKQHIKLLLQLKDDKNATSQLSNFQNITLDELLHVPLVLVYHGQQGQQKQSQKQGQQKQDRYFLWRMNGMHKSYQHLLHKILNFTPSKWWELMRLKTKRPDIELTSKEENFLKNYYHLLSLKSILDTNYGRLKNFIGKEQKFQRQRQQVDKAMQPLQDLYQKILGEKELTQTEKDTLQSLPPIITGREEKSKFIPNLINLYIEMPEKDVKLYYSLLRKLKMGSVHAKQFVPSK
jgi:hypothetical protein